MLANTPLVGFLATEDLGTSRQFYSDVLGLPLVEATEFANVYDAGGTQLRVTLVPERAGAAYTVLGWAVEDIVVAASELREKGVVFQRHAGMDQDERDVWTSPGGARIAWFSDPDGNTLSLQAPPG